MTTEGTPLERILPHLPNGRAYNGIRTTYTTVEQVAAATDRDLLDIRLIGPGALAELRVAVQAVLNLPPPPHIPQRGSDVEAWIKRHRDEHADRSDASSVAAFYVLDCLLDEYREHSDTGTPLDDEASGPHPEGN